MTDNAVYDAGALATAPEDIRPAAWFDIVIYIVGGFGLFLFAGTIAAWYFQELSLGLLITSSVLNFLCLGGSVYVLGIRRKKLSFSSMGLVPVKDLMTWAVLGAILALGVNFIRFVVLTVMTLAMEDLSSLAMRDELFTGGVDTWYGVLLMLVGVGVLAPISEELFFRGLIYDWLRQKLGVEWGIMISSLIFGLAHYDSILVVVSGFLMGVAMAFAYEKTKSLWISIFMHISTNFVAVLLMAFSSWLLKNLEGLQY